VKIAPDQMAAVRYKRRRRKLDRVGSKYPILIRMPIALARLCPPCGNFPQVIKGTFSRTLRRLGHLLVPGIFDGEHYFLLEPIGQNRTRLTHSEKFSGLLVGLLGRTLAATSEASKP
jgi:hypothetical protein